MTDFYAKLTAVFTLFLTAFALGMFPAAANAANSGTLVPATSSWPVKRVVLDDAPPYCSMRNDFPDANVSLIFARDGEDNMSLAIDFYEDLLETGAKYSLSMVIPGQAQRTIVSDAVSPRIMVVQMGQDFGFLDSFARGNSLRIRTPGAHLHFALEGTLQSIEDFDDCTHGLHDPAAPPARTAIAVTHEKIASELPQRKPVAVKFTDAAPLPQEQVARIEAVPPHDGVPVQQPTAAVIAAATQTPPLQPNDTLETMLQSALEISALNTMHKNEGIYSWRQKKLFGNAQIFNWPKNKSFMDMVKQYLARAKARCGGDYAFNTADALALSGGNIYVSGNIACIGDGLDSAAALFFHGHDEKFTVISHEGRSTDLPKAIAMRDRLSTYVVQTQTR
ncbi:MAG: hypothetical protein EP349_02950 [Alphaproteobacteria bacterium]|nr:MAG: hypothetical protein EP349_02950 [Alphaproteobacteria bacterium]